MDQPEQTPRVPMTREQLIQRKAMIEARISRLTSRLGTAKREDVKEMISQRLAMLNSRLTRINERLSKMG